MNNSILLFRFHKEFEVCLNRIKLLRELNPDLPVHGLYGGPAENMAEARGLLEPFLSSFEMSSNQDPEWKWLHPDLTLKEWFKNRGCRLSFDYLFDYEWDILTLAPLASIYPPISKDSIALTALRPIDKVRDSWDWLTTEPHRSHYQQFCQYMKKTFDLSEQTYASLGPGPVFSRSFLERFSEEKDIDLVLSEITYPAYAEALGFSMIDTGLHPTWFSDQAQKYFNCLDIEIDHETIKEELKNPEGRRAFHPVKIKYRAL